MSKYLSDIESTYSQLLVEKTGLKITYKYLSPSLFSNARVNGIEISDIEQNKALVKIDNAELFYDIEKFASEKPLSALTLLNVSGVKIEYDNVSNSKCLERVINLFKGENKDEEEKEPFDIKLPFEVIIKDITLHYSDKMNDLLMKIKKINLDDLSSSKGGISFYLSGNATYKTENIKIGKRRAVSAVSYNISGTFFSSLNGSSATVQLSNMDNSDYTISHLNALLNYTDDKLQFRTMRTAFPFNMFAEYDFNKNNVHSDISCEGFNPFSLFTIRNKNELLKTISGSTLSGTASVDFNVDSKKTSYKTNLSVNLSEKVMGERLKVVCKSTGTEKNVNFSKLSVTSPSLSTNYVGSFNIKKLQPFGTLNLDYFVLKNGSILASEVFIEPYSVGFKCYAPQFFMNEKSFTNIELDVLPQNNSIDFSLELSDYSHIENDVVGNIKVDGSYILGKNQYIQAHADISNVFADSFTDCASVFVDSSLSQSLKEHKTNICNYITTCEAYFSSDLKNFSYNVPYAVIANVNKEKEILTFAVDGSNQIIQISSLDLEYGKNSVQANAAIDISSGFDDISFNCGLSINSLPYNFNGNFASDWLYLSGDYGFDSMISFTDNISGFFQFDSFPIAFSEYIVSFSTMSTFSYSKIEGFNMAVARFEVAEVSGRLNSEPKLSFSGELSNYGFIFNSMTYSDISSELDMGGSIGWSINNDIFENVKLELFGKSPVSSEHMEVTAEINNSQRLPFSFEALINDFEITAFAAIDSFPASRFMSDQKNYNVINAEVLASGTVSNPFISINISKADLMVSGYPLIANGSAVLENSFINVVDFNVDWAFFNISNFTANCSLKDFSGTAKAMANINLAERTMKMPLEFTIESVIEETTNLFNIPEYFSIAIKSDNAFGSMLKKPIPINLNVVHIPGQFDIFTNDKKGFKASIVNNSFTAKTGKNTTLMFDFEGSIEGNKLDFFITDIKADLQKISSFIDIPMVTFHSGILNGDIRIAGLTTDPEFAGLLELDDFALSVPMISKEYIKADNIIITAGVDGINIAESLFTCGYGKFFANADITFDRWSIDSIFLKLSMVGNKGVPVDMELPFMYVKGDAFADLELSFNLPNDMAIKGSIMANNTDVEIVMSELQNQLTLEGMLSSLPKSLLSMANMATGGNQQKDDNTNEEQSLMNVLADLNIMIGQNVRVMFNPLLRGIITPNTPISYYMDSTTGEFAITGDVSLHGGEVAWLNRNFYMKEGRIVLNETQDNIDPHITLRAETREQDTNGNRVTIILSALNQPLSQFNPTFSSTPAKSEYEIMTLLGQVITADSDDISSFVMAGGDYLVQTTVFRKLENTLRELCNFDIFSFRTNVLQNAIKQGLNKSDKTEKTSASSSNIESSSDDQISFGNFFDNSTVYIGKYFGSEIYVDAMFHWVYDKEKLDDGSSTNGIVFQPEFGFEMASPLVNIRLGVAPDIDAIQQNLWVSSTSITLSWKHSF